MTAVSAMFSSRSTSSLRTSASRLGVPFSNSTQTLVSTTITAAAAGFRASFPPDLSPKVGDAAALLQIHEFTQRQVDRLAPGSGSGDLLGPPDQIVIDHDARSHAHGNTHHSGRPG